MKEEIILSNINDRELCRSLALYGKGSFNRRFFNSEDLAKEVLNRSGIILEEEQISNTKGECIVYSLLKDIKYFENNNFEDAKKIYKAINYSRLLCRGNEEEKLEEVFNDGEFKEKNNAILEVYKKYKQHLKDNNLNDSIDIINYAIKNAKGINGDFIVLNETPLEPLEEELLKVVSNGKYDRKSIKELADVNDKSLSGISYDNAYGTVNEVEHALGTIVKEKIPYEDVVIALVDSSYLYHFMSYKDIYNIPMTFATGFDISLFNSFKVLTLIDRWNKGFNGKDALETLLYAPEFDINKLWSNVGGEDLHYINKNNVVKIIGNLRISVNRDDSLDKYKNSLIKKDEIALYPYVEGIANEFYKGYSYLIKTYTKNELGDLETKAINTICSYIDEYFENIKEGSLIDIINDLSNKRINRELSKPGTIHIVDLKGALSTIRKHLFICGLNAKVFPGSPSEDYLLLDSDLDRFKEKCVKKSTEKIRLNKELLLNVLHNASSFGNNIHLSYSGYNLSDLKEENASSMLFEIFKEEHGENSTTEEFNEKIGEQHKYFDEDFSALTRIGRKYLDGVTIKELDDKEDELSSIINNKEISPSSAEIFFACPKRFYLAKLLGIKEPSEDSPFKEIPANDEGELIHECMEDYGNNPSWTLDEFMINAKKKFDDYLNKRKPIHDKNISYLKKTFLDMAKQGYIRDPHNEVYASEVKLSYKDPITGLTFGGRVDRIERLNSGKYQIVDYKTYKEFKNDADDIEKCFQVVLYAYLFEGSKNKEVENCQYRYLRNVEEFDCIYNEGMKSQLQNRLKMIKDALDSGVFPCNPGKHEENCKYCKLSNVCGKEKETKDE